ncbi:MAG: ATP-binding protein [Nitrospirota bacterium]
MKALKTNILLLVLVIFVISLIITLNVFFQQSYQSEMAEQFNRQQLLIAKSIAKNIEGEMQRLEEEMLSFSRLVADRGLDDKNMEEFVNNAFAEIREDININIKVLDNKGRLRYSSFYDSMDAGDLAIFELAKKVAPDSVGYHYMIAEARKIVMFTSIRYSSQFKGALIMEVMINAINKKFLAPIRAGIRGHAWMMDGSGTLLFHPTQPRMVGKNLYRADSSCFECHKSFEVEKKILESGDIGFSSYIAPYGEDKLIAFSKARISQMSWIVCVSIPYSEVTLSIRKSMKLHSLLVISIFIATVAGAFTIVMINRQRVKAEEKAKFLETRQLLEREILQTKDYLENLLESTESKIMVLDKDMIIRTVNSAHERLCRIDKDDIIGKNFFDIFPIGSDDDRNMIRQILDKCLEGSSHRLSNYPYIRDDRTLYLNISLNPLVLHGEVSGIILSSSDVTEEVNLKEELKNYASKLEDTVRKRTDELLSEKEKLNAIVETLEAGLFIVDGERNITWINRTLREWIGEERVKDVTFETIYGGTEIQRSIVDNRMIQEVIYQDLGRRKGYFQITSTPLIGPDGNVQALVLVQDITEMKKMEEQMMHSEKLSALARISAGVAHEIGNPLTSISSYIQILREMDFDDFTKESLETIAKHINRITDIVRQMSSFSRTTVSELKPHNIHEIVDLTLELVKYDKRMKNIRSSVDIPLNLPDVISDETQLIQVFMNIILNAADVMPDGGALDIKAERLNGEIEVSFSDSGPGIPPEHMEKIFDPFFTTKEKGTGLGLAVSYDIIKSYRGDILVENKPGGGTIFKVRLPYRES